MLLAPLLLLVVASISPENSSNAQRQLTVVARHPDRWYVSDLLAILALCLLIPAIFGLMQMLRERAPRICHVGGSLALAGVVAVAFQTALGLVEWQMIKGGADRDQMAALLHRLEQSAGVAPVLIAAGLLALGLTLLAFGLYRIGEIGLTTASAIALGAILVDVGYELPSGALTIAAAALTALGLGRVGWRLLLASGAPPRDRRGPVAGAPAGV
ncbi:MAG TPA: hypothetical protein VHE14_07540 [Solirubrobacteraceae bacterium]|nr:hypothetical protein [Solirubrobacteraceae bacterium]